MKGKSEKWKMKEIKRRKINEIKKEEKKERRCLESVKLELLSMPTYWTHGITLIFGKWTWQPKF